MAVNLDRDHPWSIQAAALIDEAMNQAGDLQWSLFAMHPEHETIEFKAQQDADSPDWVASKLKTVENAGPWDVAAIKTLPAADAGTVIARGWIGPKPQENVRSSENKTSIDLRYWPAYAIAFGFLFSGVAAGYALVNKAWK